MTKTPLVLLPGVLLDERLYAAQIAALGDVAAIRIGDLTGADSIAGIAGAVLAQAPERFALCGLSLGGYVAFEIMRRAPERVLRLALLDTQARPDSPEARERRLSLIARAERGEFEAVIGQLVRLFIHPDRLADEALVETITAMARKVGQDGFLRQQTAALNRIDSRPALGAITCPTLVLVGRQDVVTPPEAHGEIAAAIPNATLVVLPECGHLSPLEQPAMVSAQLHAWLTLG
jgi:pimeloyl-ACP methyl ester carboxylesterase